MEVVTLHGQVIPYEIRASTKARAIRLTVSPDKGLVVHRGRLVPKKAIEAYICEKSEWIRKAIEYYENQPEDITKKLTPAQIKKYKADALAIVQNRLPYFNSFYGFTYNRISIRDQKTRWGSCSPKGNIQFNYRIGLISPHLADYILVHELCHLAQLNHSKKFWALVAKTIPDYASCRKALRAQPLSLQPRP